MKKATPTDAAGTSAREFLDRFDEVSQRLADQGPDWARATRAAGRERFARTGWPSPSEEPWRNTNVKPVVTSGFRPAARAARRAAVASGLAAETFAETRLTFVDGRFAPEQSTTGSLPAGVWVGNLGRALAEVPEQIREHLASSDDDGRNAFAALNDAFLEDGAVILVPDGLRLDRPVQVVYLGGGSAEPVACHPRTLLVAGREASAELVEIYGAPEGDPPAPHLTNAISTTVLGDGAHVRHYRIQVEHESGYHVSTIASVQGRDSRLDAFNVNLGGRLVRHDVRARIAGEGAYCNLLGLYLTHRNQHVDNHTTLDHAAAHCGSREVYKGILDDRSRTVFTGRIIVREGAQKTDAKQSNPNLLLSSEALAHTRPQLEIYADDVKCTHGATVGQMDADALFYLRSRGIAAKEARNLLIHAFAGEVLEHVELEPLRDALERIVGERLDEKATS